MLWAMTEAKDEGVNIYDAGREKEIKTRAQFRLDIWAIHVRSPTAALAKTSEGLEQGEIVPSATSEW